MLRPGNHYAKVLIDYHQELHLKLKKLKASKLPVRVSSNRSRQ